MLDCRPATITGSDSLVVAMGMSHGPYLAIRRPDGTSFFIAYPRRGDTTAPPPLIPESDFARLREVTFAISDLKASPWTAREIMVEPVFSIPGDYTLILAENLESDAGYPRAECVVTLAKEER